MSQNLVAVCYKVLRYIEACRSKGAQPDPAQALRLSEAGEMFFADACESMASKGFVSGVEVTRCISGRSEVSFDDARITYDGSEFLADNAGMLKAARALGPAYETAVGVAVAQLLKAMGV